MGHQCTTPRASLYENSGISEHKNNIYTDQENKQHGIRQNKAKLEDIKTKKRQLIFYLSQTKNRLPCACVYI